LFSDKSALLVIPPDMWSAMC